MSGKNENRKKLRLIKGRGEGGDPFSSAYSLGKYNPPPGGEHLYYTEDLSKYDRKPWRKYLLVSVVLLLLIVVVVGYLLFFPH